MRCRGCFEQHRFCLDVGLPHGPASSRAGVAESLFVAGRQAWHRHVPDYRYCSRTTMRAVQSSS
jgi:hypothetical protein